MSDDDAVREPKSAAERRVLGIALWLNLGLVATLGAAGVAAASSGLIATAADNLSDAAVYALSYYAVTRGRRWKVRAARLSGAMLLVLSLAVLADVVRRFIFGAEPVSAIMIVMSVVAALVNVASLRVLRPLHTSDVNLRAAWTFSINDLVANLGVLAAGVLVAWSGQSWPDLLAGLAIAFVAAKGGREILADARRTGDAEGNP